jgi:hypothetical protein
MKKIIILVILILTISTAVFAYDQKVEIYRVGSINDIGLYDMGSDINRMYRAGYRVKSINPVNGENGETKYFVVVFESTD